jgi:hypothetical protein
LRYGLQNIDTVMRLESRITERLKSNAGGVSSSSSAHRRSRSSSTNEWALLARYAAHLKQEDDRKKTLEAHTRAEKAKEDLRLQQEAAVARQKVRGFIKLFLIRSFLSRLLILTFAAPYLFLTFTD